MLKLLKLSTLNDERAPHVIFFFLTVLFLCLPDSRAAEDLGGAALGVLRDHGPWGRVRGRGAATARGGAARGGRTAPSSPPRRRRRLAPLGEACPRRGPRRQQPG